MSPRAEDIALEAVIWRARREGDIHRWPRSGDLRQSFANHCSARHRLWHVEDIRNAVDAFATGHPTLADWYGALLAPFSRSLCFESGAPRLRVGALSAWRKLTARVDPDALVALRLAVITPAGDPLDKAVAALPAWRFYLDMADHGLASVLAPGVGDTHIHFEASDPMPLLWLRLCSGKARAGELQHYSDATLARLREDSPALHRRRTERVWLDEARDDRIGLLDALGLAGGEPDDAVSALRRERIMLAYAWRAIRLDPADPNVLGRLDRYLFAKNLFLHRHQQSANQGPGLTRFRDFLDRGETIAEKRHKKVRPRVRRQRFDRMLSLATEAPCLRILELRIAPQKTLKGWRDFFTLWRDRYDPGPAGKGVAPGVAIRFVVHFIRDANPASVKECNLHFGKLRRSLDRQTALLQLFRRSHPDLAAPIVGIDVANLERGCGPELFAPYLLLLRGEDRLAGSADHAALECWGRLAARGLHRPPPQLPTLGLTYHAGEDFHHPVAGMRSMSGLVRNVLRPGDRIGHGLAVGIDITRYQRERGNVGMPNGVLLDDLVWLRREARVLGCWVGEPQRWGDEVINEMARYIYGADVSEQDVELLQDARYSTPRAADARKSPASALAHLEATDAGIRERRAEMASSERSASLLAASAVATEVQAATIRSMRDAGISVEANPTSNLVTGAVDRLGDHPFFRYLEVLGEQTIVSINSDDPGVFGTRIDVEYALMFEAMLENGFDRQRALDVLDRTRRVAETYAFGARPSLA